MLEVGTGSGYQAAVLAELAKTVYTIEIVEPLALQAEQRLRSAGLRATSQVRVGDGYYGWEDMRRSTPSSSPRRPATFRRRWCASSSPAAGW